MSEQAAEWFLPIGGPVPGDAMLPERVWLGRWEKGKSRISVPVLGPPVRGSEIAAPLSPEAQAVLDAAAEVGRNLNTSDDPGGIPLLKLKAASQAYDRTLTPPDPLAEARDALRLLDTPGANQGALARLHAALAKLGAKP